MEKWCFHISTINAFYHVQLQAVEYLLWSTKVPKNVDTAFSSFYENSTFVVDINREILGAVQVGLGPGYINRVLVQIL